MALGDPNWRLIVVGLDDQLRLQALATVRHSEVVGRAPRDFCAEAKWQSASHQLTPKDLQSGLHFLEANLIDSNSLVESSIHGGNGAKAMIAYARLQDPRLPELEREDLRKQLLRYCELDTLAMVMVYEAIRGWL